MNIKTRWSKGIINEAYQGLMAYIMGLRTYFKNKYPDQFVVGSFYQGYMDMTYFPITPGIMQASKIKNWDRLYS